MYCGQAGVTAYLLVSTTCLCICLRMRAFSPDVSFRANSASSITFGDEFVAVTWAASGQTPRSGPNLNILNVCPVLCHCAHLSFTAATNAGVVLSASAPSCIQACDGGCFSTAGPTKGPDLLDVFAPPALRAIHVYLTPKCS